MASAQAVWETRSVDWQSGAAVRWQGGEVCQRMFSKTAEVNLSLGEVDSDWKHQSLEGLSCLSRYCCWVHIKSTWRGTVNE